MSEFDLHPERLGTTDEVGRRIFPQPSDVRGRFRQRRTLVQIVLLLIFMTLPWFRIAGRQALLFDITNRHFEFFGLTLRAHNAPLLFLVLAAFCFGLFFVTAVWGRVWCGWACPQTVFIDGIYRRIERFIEGPGLERRKLARAPWTTRKVTLRAVKWSAFAIVSTIIAHSFMAYFIGTEELAKMITHAPSENLASFTFMVVMTGFLMFDFGWFREQFCVIACPYGRFQSVLMDSNSMIVAYDTDRGEPRATPQAKALAKNHSAKLGDCVNCYRCVQVCPVGIDIRRGLQLECIACTACIDACDDVMTKIKKPTGLIRYDSLNGLKKKPVRKFNVRSIAYGTVAGIALILLFALLDTMTPVEVVFLRAKETPYQVEDDGLIFNHFKLEITNETDHPHELEFVTSDSNVSLVSAPSPFPIAKDDLARTSLFVKFPRTLLHDGSATIHVEVIDHDNKTGTVLNTIKELSLVGPLR